MTLVTPLPDEPCTSYIISATPYKYRSIGKPILFSSILRQANLPIYSISMAENEHGLAGENQEWKWRPIQISSERGALNVFLSVAWTLTTIAKEKKKRREANCYPTPNWENHSNSFSITDLLFPRRFSPENVSKPNGFCFLLTYSLIHGTWSLIMRSAYLFILLIPQTVEAAF